jgi:hypothetical protein
MISDALERGREYGRAWARNKSTSRAELERLFHRVMACDCHSAHAESASAQASSAQRVFDVIHPDRAGDVEAAEAWWQTVLPSSESSPALQQVDDFLVAGFVAGATEVYFWSQRGKA